MPPRLRRAPDIAAVALVLAGCLVVARVARHVTFSGDDWSFLLDRRGWGAEVFLRPHGEHLSALPILAYKLLLKAFGAGSYAPFMALALLVHGVACLLLYVLARRRVGPWAALAPTAVLVLLGPAWQDLLWAFQVGYFGSVAAGLGSVVCLERGDRRGDVAAAALLVVSLLCSSLGLAMVVLAAVLLVLGTPRWRRLWVVGVPLALYALWYAGYGVSAARGENVSRIPSYLAHALSAAMASVTGLARTDVSPYLVSTTYGRFIALAVVVGLVVHLVRGGRPPALAWAAMAAALALWTAQCLAFFPSGREAEQSRYQYAAAALVLLAVVAIAPGSRPTRLTGAVLAIVTLIVVVSNAAMLHQRSAFWTGNSLFTAAETGAIEVARDVVAPDFVPEDVYTAAGIGVHNLQPVSAGRYLSAVDAFGSPADTPAEILRRPEDVREAADVVLAHAERLSVAPGAGAGCRSTPTAAEVAVGPGTLTAGNGPGPGADLQLRRFASRARFVRFKVGDGATVRLKLPRDRSSLPWHVRLAGGQQTRLCTP
ncbi:MAG: hypothetical protein QOE53_3114 [Pseudonocardiales bacterium]|nr:hypothetical protein [Pseudonocardiales bacterium]